jgi:N-acetylglutamate synthase-like GNAT family acetyltransferase
MQLTLRAASNPDRAAIEKLVFGVLAEHGLTPDPTGTDADLRDIEKSYLSAGGLFDVLVDEKDQVVGSVALFPLAHSVCELRKMYLHESMRGSGQGRRLLEHALHRAVELGFSRVELETASVLEKAVALYERRGFKRYIPDHLAGRCDSAYYLDLNVSGTAGHS